MPQQFEKFRSTANLNVREGPATTFKIFGRLTVNHGIEKIGESADGNWVKILVTGREGWSSKRYLAKVPYIPPEGEDFPWMAIAEQEQGVSEIPGTGNNPLMGRIVIGEKDEKPIQQVISYACGPRR